MPLKVDAAQPRLGEIGLVEIRFVEVGAENFCIDKCSAGELGIAEIRLFDLSLAENRLFQITALKRRVVKDRALQASLPEIALQEEASR